MGNECSSSSLDSGFYRLDPVITLASACDRTFPAQTDPEHTPSDHTHVFPQWNRPRTVCEYARAADLDRLVDDKTLFMAAAAQVPRHPKLIDLLGDPAVATSRGVNALHFASRYCSKTVIREIISRAPGLVESQDASGAAPVAHAIVAGRSRGVVEMLAGGGHIVGIKGYNVFGHIINTARYDLMGIFNDLPRLRADKMLARANADGAPDWVLRTLWRGMAPADIIPIVLNRVNLVAELAQAECTICSRPSTDMFVNTICGHSHLCGECVARITTCPCCNAAHAYIRMY